MPKTNGYSNTNRQAEKQRKREEGEQRNAAWAALSPQEQLKQLPKRGNSAKQIRKLKFKLGISEE